MRTQSVHTFECESSFSTVGAARPRVERGLKGKGYLALLFWALPALILTPASLLAQAPQAPVNLGSAGNYVVLTETGITDVPPSVITGNIGSSPITGAAIHLTCAEVIGTISAVDAAGPAPCALIVPAALGTAVLDMHTAYSDAAGRTVPDFTELFAGNISGKTLVPGLYKWSTDVMVDSTGVTLSGGPNAVWIFQIAGDVLLANNGHINLAGGAQANNIFWQVAGPTSVTIGTGAVFSGNILSSKQIILNSGATLNGRAYAFTQVTLQSTGVTNPGPLVDGIPPPLSPTVTSTVPANQSTGVPIGNKLSATFSEAMDPTTITASTFQLKNGIIPILGTVTYVGVTATFTPSVPLPPNTLLTATITMGAKDPAGVGLSADYVWTFTTGIVPDTTPPTVSFTVPANGSINALTGSALAATFSEAMSASSINTTSFLLKQGSAAVAGSVSYAGVTATFTPASALMTNTVYTATITTGVLDLAGNAMASNYVWSFTTGTAPDTTPPTVSSTVPAQGATNVPVANAIAVTFSEPMAPLSINTTTFLLKQGSLAVAGTVSYVGVTATFTPASTLAPNTLYTATITVGATDLAGNALAANYAFSFTTGATADVTSPTVSSTIPANGAANVAIGSTLAATFSEAMAPLSVNTNSFLLKQGVTAIPGTVGYAGVTATFTPLIALAPNTVYTATITTGVTDLAGNAPILDYVWSFTTGAAIDTTPPTVSSTVPIGGSTNVPVGNALAVTFSEAMAPASVNTTSFLLRQGSTAIVGTVSYAGVTATFTPASALMANTVYTATITTSVLDLAGNAMASNYVWSFTTGTTPDTTPPTVSSTVPAGGATNVPVGNAVAVTFSEPMAPLSINTTTFLLKQGSLSVAGTVNYAGVTATFVPANTLASNTLYTATVTVGATDLAGNALTANYAFSFTTGTVADVTPPTVSSTIPASGASNVAIGSALAATFSEAMAPLSVNTNSFLLKQGVTAISGTVGYAGVTATFTPLTNLAPNTVYTATITTAVTDLAGNAPILNYVWSFTTGAAIDTTPPTVSSTVPTSGAANVPVGNALAVTFSEAMAPTSVNTTSFLLKQGSTAIAGTVSYVGVTATFTPLSALAHNTGYTATITTGVTDLAGNALAASYAWSFTTGSAADTTRPVVISTVPASGVSGVAGTTLSATFSEAMAPLSVNTSTFQLKQAGLPIAGTVTYAGVTATFIPSIPLAPLTMYTATMTSAVTDLAGNAMTANYTWSFTTAGVIVLPPPPPDITATIPTNGATLVTTTTNVSATFSAAMDPLTINTETFLLTQGGIAVPGTVTSAGVTATFRPSSNLMPNAEYVAMLTTAVADLAGTPLQANYQWTFTTGSSAGQAPVCLTSFAILAGTSIIATGTNVITGDIGVSPGNSVSGFPPGTVQGTIHSGDAAAAQAMKDLTAAYADAVARSVGSVVVSGDLGGRTLTAGLYSSASTLGIAAGDLTLDAKGDPNAVFIIQSMSSLIVSNGRQVVLAGGAQAFNVFWQVGCSATLGTGSLFQGSILAEGSITLSTGVTVNGRLLAHTGTVTLQSDTVTSPGPAIATAGIYNAASWTGMVAAGSIASVFGSNLGASPMAAASYPLPTSLGGGSIQFNAQSAPLYMTSCTQTNVQIPWETAAQSPVSVTATFGSQVSAAQAVTIAPYAPGLFSMNMAGNGQGAVQIAPTSQLAAPVGPLARPVKKGEYIAIFCTGLGPVSNQPATGAAATSGPLSETSVLPIVTVGGASARVTYSGLAPGFAGLYQVNAVVPDGAPSGSAVNLVLTIQGVASNTVTIAVQ